MPTLHSLSIRRRGTTPVKSAAAPATTTQTIKGLFHRKTIDSTPPRSSNDKDTEDKMGNAPSDMNGNANGAPKQKSETARASTSDRDSVRSRAMPGAEPPTPTPAPEPTAEKSGDECSPEPNTTQVQGYDTQDVPHVLNSNPVENDVTEAKEQRDLEAGIPNVLGSFEFEEPQTIEEEPTAEPTDTTRTPRVELKTEEYLAPLDLTPSRHAPEASDATAVAISPRASTPPVWSPGTYVLLNARGGTAVDLSGADNKTVIGYPMHGGPNQQWEFIPTGHGYIIRCVRRSSEGHSLYLTTDGSVKHGATIVASPFPVAWNVEPTEDGIRISWPNSEFSFDLADWGSSAAGTKIQLAHRREEPCQLWHYTRCAAASESEKDKALVDGHVTSARAVSPPATTETITIAEEDNHVTTTRTTTTTVITTVTEVTRTPKSLLRQAQPQRRSVAYR